MIVVSVREVVWLTGGRTEMKIRTWQPAQRGAIRSEPSNLMTSPFR